MEGTNRDHTQYEMMLVPMEHKNVKFCVHMNYRFSFCLILISFIGENLPPHEDHQHVSDGYLSLTEAGLTL